MKASGSIALIVGTIVGFLACSFLGRWTAPRAGFDRFLRLHPFLERESAFFPTASQLATTARHQCPPGDSRVLVVLGGNSVFNGSGQTSDRLWSRQLQAELGAGFHVINLSAPGAGPMDYGGVVYEMLSRDYSRLLFVTNTEPGLYPHPADTSQVFWDAYEKHLLRDDVARRQFLESRTPSEQEKETRLGYRLDSVFYFDDLWSGVAYRSFSTVWTSWLKERSFWPRAKLGDWYDRRRPITPGAPFFTQIEAGQLASLRGRPLLDVHRYSRGADGSFTSTMESQQSDARQITQLLPAPLPRRSLIVFTPLNPWFVERLTADERAMIDTGYENGARLVTEAGYRVLSTKGQFPDPLEFGDLVHLQPRGGDRLANIVAAAIREMAKTEGLAP